MTDEAKSGSHPNVIPLHPEPAGKMRVDLTRERLLRIKMRMAELKMDQAMLAEAIGLSNSAVSQIFKGKIKATRHFEVIAKALKVNTAWLMSETDQRVDLRDWTGETLSEADLPALLERPDFDRASIETVPTDEIAATGFDRKGHSVAVPEIDLTQVSRRLIGGIPVLGPKYMIGRSLIEMHTRTDPAHIMVVHGIGDAMEPVLNNSDLLFIDTSRRSIQWQDVIWLVRYAGLLSIRRVRMTPNGLHLMADNPLLGQQVVQAQDLEVLGRVVGSLRKF